MCKQARATPYKRGRSQQLRMMQRRMADRYDVYRMFRHAPKGLDREYGARNLREARYWMTEIRLLRRHLRKPASGYTPVPGGGMAHPLSDLDGRR